MTELEISKVKIGGSEPNNFTGRLVAGYDSPAFTDAYDRIVDGLYILEI